MWPQRQGRDQRDSAQIKNNVAGEQSRRFLAEINFVVGPLKLPHHPHGAAQRQQHPEKIAPPVRCAGIDQQSRVCKKWHEALHHVANRRQLRSGPEIVGCGRIEGKERRPGSDEPCDLPKFGHTAISLFHCRPSLTVAAHSYFPGMAKALPLRRNRTIRHRGVPASRILLLAFHPEPAS